jgi:hypothetical protein
MRLGVTCSALEKALERIGTRNAMPPWASTGAKPRSFPLQRAATSKPKKSRLTKTIRRRPHMDV